MLFRLIVTTRDGLSNDTILIEVPHDNADHTLAYLVADPGGAGYRLGEIISLLIPSVKSIGYDFTPVIVPRGTDTILRWPCIDPAIDNLADARLST